MRTDFEDPLPLRGKGLFAREKDDLDGGFNSAINPCVVAGMIGAAVVGGVISSAASGSAADTQAEAAGRASDAQSRATAETNAMQMAMYRQNMATNAPYLQSGQTAQAALMQGLGLGQLRATGTQGAGAQSQPPQTIENFDAGAYYRANPDVQAAGMNAYEHWQQYGRGEGRPFTFAPGASGGTTNYGATQEELNAGAGSLQPGQLNKPFAPSDLTTDPSYQWRLAQGQRSLESSAAARGGLLTGQGAADITNYGQGAASQEYGAAFDRHRTVQNDLYNRLAALGGIGQIATGAAGTYGSNAANQIGQNIMQGTANQNAFGIGAANAQAGADIGAANAWNRNIQGGMSNWTTLQGQQAQPGGAGYNYQPNNAATNAGQLYGPPQTFPSEDVFSTYTG